MRVLIVMDSFKNNISSSEASAAVSAGVLRVCPRANIRIMPIADGGEGTVEAFVHALGGELRSDSFSSPLGPPCEASWGLLPGKQAVIEIAAASGLSLVPRMQRNPLLTSTRGTGEQLLAALDAGCRSILIGLGGSATNDGAMGILASLGVRFLDSQNNELPACGASLRKIASIDMSHLDPRLSETHISLACDVVSPLCGVSGAAAVYGPQKGADEAAVAELDAGLANFAAVIRRTTGCDVLTLRGGGAAGGAAAGMAGLINAVPMRGVDVLAKVAGLDDAIAWADVIFTGEGRIDFQTTQGKVISGIAARVKEERQRSRNRSLVLVALVGSLRGPVGPLLSLGLTAVLPIGQGPCPFPVAIDHTRADLERTAAQVMRLIRFRR